MRKYSSKPGDDLDQHRFASKPFACWLRSCTKLVISWWVTSTTLNSVLWHVASEYVNQLTVHIPCTAGKPLLEKYIAHIHSGAACVWRILFLKQIMKGCITNFHKYLYLKSLFGINLEWCDELWSAISQLKPICFCTQTKWFMLKV
jgi:hypothetical protein